MSMLKTAQDVDKLKQELADKIAAAYGVNSGTSGTEVEQAKQQLAELAQVKTVRLTVARELNQRQSDKIYQQLAPQLRGGVMEIEVDSGVLGGAKVEFGGKYYDGTIKNKLEEYWS